MFRKTLICSDLTPASDALIRCAQELKDIGMEEVILAHVIYVKNTPGLEERLTEEARPVITGQRTVLEAQGLKVVVELPCGLPVHTLNDVAERHDVSFILIGSHGKGRLQGAALGSISLELLQASRRPVLLARNALLEEGKSDVVCRKMFNRVLFPTDFSETAEKALDYLGKIALETGCAVTVMHVLEAKAGGPAETQREEEAAQYLLDAKQRRLQTLGAHEVTIELLHGKASEEIVRRAEKGDFSIIIMGGQGKGFLKEIFLGSVANEVARHAAVPLLFVPASN